jgi:hypothetical protein
MKLTIPRALQGAIERRFVIKKDEDGSHENQNHEDMSMKKLLVGAIIAAVLFCIGYFLGLNRGVRKNIASVEIVNESGMAIMTATIRHEAGTVIVANIKKNRRERVRFYTKGPNSYTLSVTLENNRTLYCDTSRVILSGETVKEVVGDSTISPIKDAP